MNSKEYLMSLPPSSHNNDRRIMRGKIGRFGDHPSESRAAEIENISQGELEADFLDKDLGNEGRTGKPYGYMEFEIVNAEEISRLN